MRVLTTPLVKDNWIRRTRLIVGTMLLCFVCGALGTIALFQTQVWLYEQPTTAEVSGVIPFPVGVDKIHQYIDEQPNVSAFFYSQYAESPRRPDQQYLSLWKRALVRLARTPAIQNLASPVSRILVIWPGERHEQVVDNIGDILRWDAEERERFSTAVTARSLPLTDGVFAPGKYVVGVDASPEEVAGMVNARFDDEVIARYPETVEAAVPLQDALIVASLLEREARDFIDMRVISGVIWNRLFLGMRLQLDATLQYVKGSRPTGPWWPVVRPNDKYLNSPYNTYQHAGLPPGPIGNPSPEAILAALNPKATDCLFYFHTEDGGFYCSTTYEAHVAKLKSIYGQGR